MASSEASCLQPLARSNGELTDPGLLGWFWQLFGGRCCAQELRGPTGYLGRWTLPAEMNAEDLRADWVQRSIKLKHAKSMLRCRPGEDIGGKIVWSLGVTERGWKSHDLQLPKRAKHLEKSLTSTFNEYERP